MNRRGFLAGLLGFSGLVAAGRVEAARYRVVRRVGGGGLARVGPHASWNGTAGAGAGATAPTFIYNGSTNTRPGATCAAKWVIPSNQVFTSDIMLGVDVDALGGVAYVDFFGACVTTRVTTAIAYSDTDVNGTTRTRLIFGILLNRAAFTAVAAAGTANFYATVTANDGTIATRTIGISTANPGDFPMQLFPRASGPAKTYTYGAGQTYTDLAAARTAYLADMAGGSPPETVEFKCGTTGTYDLPSYTSLNTSHTGYAVFSAAPGVTATLTRGTSFTATPTGAISDWDYAWNWMPFCGPIEFRGSGVKLDMRYWTALMVFGSKPHWFNGCTITNSNPSGRDQLEWNKQAHPGLKTFDNSSSGIDSYFTDVIVSAVQGIGGLVLSGMKAQNAWANHDGCRYISGCYETGIDPSFFFNPVNAISVTYGGAGTAIIVVDENARTLICKVNGSAVLSISFSADQFGQRPSDTYYNMSAVASAITAIAGGSWAATALDSTRAGVALVSGSGAPSVTTTPSNLTAKFGFHTEWFHAIGGTPLENLIHRDNIVRRSYYTTTTINHEAGVRDYIAKGNVWESATNSTTNGGLLGNHLVFANNYYDNTLQVNASDAYSICAQNVCKDFAFAIAEASCILVKDNATTGTPPTGGSNSGNFTIADMDADIIGDKVAGNFSPKVAGTLASNKKTRIDLLDGLLGSRAATDMVGPWRSGAVAPSYPY